jgi:glycosyltransferase involved in cell wall biosynthesis
MRNALETACGVVANSAYTLATLADFAATEGTRLPPSTVAWPGTPILPPASPHKDSEPTFVILGTIEGRKNHNLLLSLWRRLTDAATGPVPRLIIVGRRGWRADDVIARLERENFAGKVIEMGPLDDPNLAEVLSGARALLFPSFAEGYGIPLIEALAAGVPVIASDLPVFREIGQGVPELLPATDHDAWHEAILDYANPASPRRAEQLQRMIGFRPQEWRNHFTELDDFLSRLTVGPRLS